MEVMDLHDFVRGGAHVCPDGETRAGSQDECPDCRAYLETITLPDPTLTGPEVLLMAADVVMERGFCRGTLEDARGRVCALGALGVAASGEAWHDNGHADLRGTTHAFREAHKILTKHLRDNGYAFGVIDWNDEVVTRIPFTKHAERCVAKEMRKAAREHCA